MNRTELILVISAILLATFIAGWVARWAYGKINNLQTGSVAEIDALASRLHEAEEAKEQTIAAFQQKEWEFNNRLGQAEAELAAAMDGLGSARREADELRAYLEAQLADKQ